MTGLLCAFLRHAVAEALCLALPSLHAFLCGFQASQHGGTSALVVSAITRD